MNALFSHLAPTIIWAAEEKFQAPPCEGEYDLAPPPLAQSPLVVVHLSKPDGLEYKNKSVDALGRLQKAIPGLYNDGLPLGPCFNTFKSKVLLATLLYRFARHHIPYYLRVGCPVGFLSGILKSRCFQSRGGDDDINQILLKRVLLRMESIKRG
jgi:hypothetical protein